jgi:two-component system sensor histidine kinase BarA
MVRTLYLGFSQEGDELFFIKTDKKRLQQVLLNLYSNAVKFTNRNGQIKICVELVSKWVNDIKVRELQIFITDNGMGIKEENHKQIFQMFGSIKDEKTKINLDGIGLGLVISKLIVEKFNGEINFFSKYNNGSTFFFSFETKDML